ncbi:MAG TPA: AAA family ATPase [Candidatus Limnocylindria bacterium]|nr:AAA family ATPase [Candidatus Limnocylindria bacterium]
MAQHPSGHPAALGPVSSGLSEESIKQAAAKQRRARKHDVVTKPEVAATAEASEIFAFSLLPKQVAKHLDRFVIGQREAKKVLGVALCDHFQHVRLSQEGNGAPFYQKQNILLLGPTGVGKTHLIRSAAELIGVPFVKADATKFSETGYVGSDVDDLVRDLVRKAGGDAGKAAHGIIYLDEADKLATRGNMGGRDVSGRGVQTNLLKLMEDGDVPLVSQNDVTGQIQSAVAAMRGGGGGSPETINTRHILFIVSGAFSGLDQIIKQRLQATEPAAKLKRMSVDQLLALASTQDLINYGLEPEFIGRLPVRVSCHSLDTADLFEVLRRSESSLIHQYERAFGAYGIEAKFTDDGLRRLAEMAFTERTGARGLMTVCERVFRDLKFALPSTRIKSLEITGALVKDPKAELQRILKASKGSR